MKISKNFKNIPSPSPTEVADSKVTTGSFDADKKQLNFGRRLKRLNPRFLLLLIGVVVVAGLLYFFLTGGFNRNTVVIGNTRITKKDITNYAQDLSAYEKAHPGTSFGKDLNQYASDKLILNAALKLEAKKYNVTISDTDMATAAGQTFQGSQGATDFVNTYRNASNPLGIINLENMAYQAKLQDKLIGKENLTMVTMILDTPYFDSLSGSKAQAAYDAAQTRMKSDFLPLVAKGEPETKIAQKADIAYQNSPAESQVYNDYVLKQSGLYFTQGVAAVSEVDGYQKGVTGFNDTNSTSWVRAKLGNISATTDKINQLQKVGDNTGVFASKAGALMIIRLDSRSGGSYNSWADFLNSYKSKYASNKLKISATSITSSVVGLANSLVADITTPGLDQAWADAPGCDSSHLYTLTVVAWNNDPFAQTTISGVQLNQTRSPGDTGTSSTGATIIHGVNGCGASNLTVTSSNSTLPNCNGAFPNPGFTNCSGNSAQDNCYDAPPSFSQGPAPGGYHQDIHNGVINPSGGSNAKWQHNPLDPAFSLGSIPFWGYPDPPNSDNGIHVFPGEANFNAYTVLLLYVPNGPSWTLAPSTGVSPGTVTRGQSATFNQAMYNLGPNTANYSWYMQGSLNGAPYSSSGLPSGTVPSQGASSTTPHVLPSNSYTFPSGAATGSTYCEILTYNNPSYPSNTAYTSTGPSCVKLGFNPIQANCSYTAIASPSSGDQVLVRVQDSSGNVLIPSSTSNRPTDGSAGGSTTNNYRGDQNPAAYNPVGPGYPAGRWTNQPFYVVSSTGGGTWDYTAQGTSIEITIITRQAVSGGYQTIGYSDTGTNCYHANVNNGACSLTATGYGPNHVVVSGGTIHVSAKIYNDGPADLPGSINGHPLQLNDGDYNGNGSHWTFSQPPGGAGPIVQGGYTTVTFDLSVGSPPSGVSANDPWSATLSAHPAYSNAFAFGSGSDCAITVNVYAPFSLTPQAPNVTLLPSSEDPTSVANDTWVTESGTKVSETVTSNVYELPIAGGNVPEAPPATNPGPFSPGSTTCLFQSPAPNNESGCDPALNNGKYPVSTPVNAGDTYCADISVPVTSLPGNTAYVGPGGDIVGGGPAQQSTCPNGTPGGGGGGGVVNNKPFFKVTSGDASAGGAFSSAGNPNCSGGGVLASWNDDTGTNPSGDFGASAQIGALALGPITGFASHQSAFGNNPTGLSFANTISADKTVDTYSPKLGGNFNTAAGAGDCFTDATVPSGGSASAGPVTIGNTVISPGASQNQSVFVNGDVYITGNILYKGDNGATGPGASWSSKNDVPSMVVHATGDIKISPNVTELDGLYMSTGGKIYTCAPPASGAVPDSFISSSFSVCNKQLTVYGKFIGNQVNMGRTFGSLRDEAPITTSTRQVPGPQLGLVWTDGDGTVNTGGMRCQSFNEPSEPSSHTWGDNQLCIPSSSPVSFCFETNGAAYPCVGCNFQLIDPSNSPYYPNLQGYWQDNAICASPQNSTANLTFSWGTPTTGILDYHHDSTNNQNYVDHYSTSTSYCTLLYEDSDPDTASNGDLIWEHTYICEPLVTVPAPATVHPPSAADLAALNSGTGCSNNGGGWISPQTCAAEVFYSTPELYLSTPNIGKPSLGAQQWDAITSLPPLL